MMAGGGVRRYLNQDVNPWSTLLGVAAIIAVLALFASAGRGLIGLLVILGATLLWSVAARLRPGRTVEMHEVAHYASDCDRVWNLIKPPEMAPLLHPNIRRGHKVPGTPDGVGEQQAFELDSGISMVLEVTELTPGRRAVVRMVSPPPDVPFAVSFELTPADDGCLYRHQIELDLPRGKRLRPGYEKTWRTETNEMLGRIQTCLAQSSEPLTAWPPPM
jgi:hypothetical protein